MNFEVAAGNMRMIANMGRRGFLDSVGIARTDFDRLIGDDPWLASERNRLTNVLHTVLNASVDALGLPRFCLPAEFIAAGIAMFVSPVNIHAACVFAPPAVTNDDQGRNIKTERVSPDQLFALVSELYSGCRGSARALFEKNTGLALDAVKVVSEGSKK